MKQGQGGKGHSWRQISVLRDVNVNHKRLREEEEEDRTGRGHTEQSFHWSDQKAHLCDCCQGVSHSSGCQLLQFSFSLFILVPVALTGSLTLVEGGELVSINTAGI